MIKIKMFEEKDYPMVCEWWRRHEWPLIPLKALSEFGMIAHEDGVMLCAAWLYLMTRYWGLIEWVIVNPDAPRKARQLGLKLLLARLKEEAKVFHVEAIFSSLKSNGLIRLYEKAGFKVTDTGMSNLVLYFGDESCQPPR